MAPEPGYRAAAIQGLPDDGTAGYSAPAYILPPLSTRAKLVLLFLLALAAAVMSYLINGLLPHGEEARVTEAEDIATLTKGVLAIQQRFAADQHRALARGTHAKGTCVRGQFEVFNVFDVAARALASRLAHGIFARPGIYPAVIRFANASSQIFPDPNKDVRACSFSVDVPPGALGPLGMRQDFSMNNARTFPINDAHAFAVTTSVVAAQSPAKGFFTLRMKDRAVVHPNGGPCDPADAPSASAISAGCLLEHGPLPSRAGGRREIRRLRVPWQRIDAAWRRAELPSGAN